MRVAGAITIAAAAAASAGLLGACGGGGGGGTTTGGTATTQTAPARTQTQARTQTRARTQTQAQTTTAPSAATLAAGRQAFASNGCGSCHTLAAAGATGTVGPSLDSVLPGRSAAFIRQSIVDPNAVIASGFSAGVMPQGYEQQIPPSDLTALVAYLHAQAGR